MVTNLKQKILKQNGKYRKQKGEEIIKGQILSLRERGNPIVCALKKHSS